MAHVGDVLVIYGGKEHGTEVSNRTFFLHYTVDPMVWEEVQEQSVSCMPERRWGHSALTIQGVPMTEQWARVHRGRVGVQGVLYFAGMTPGGAALNELWFFEPYERRWTALEVGLSPSPPAAFFIPFLSSLVHRSLPLPPTHPLSSFPTSLPLFWRPYFLAPSPLLPPPPSVTYTALTFHPLAPFRCNFQTTVIGKLHIEPGQRVDDSLVAF